METDLKFDLKQNFGERALVVIDEAPLRKKKAEDIYVFFKKVESFEKQKIDFEMKDQSVFQNWYELVFRKIEAEITEKREEFLVLAEKYNQVIYLVRTEGLAIFDAYAQVLEEERIFKKGSLLEKELIEKKRLKRSEEILREMEGESDFDRIFDETFDDESFSESDEVDGIELGEESGGKNHGGGNNGRVDGAKINEELNLKTSYRRLLRLLHPDCWGNPTLEEIQWYKEIWVKTQKLYKEGNSAELNTLLFMFYFRKGQFDRLSFSDFDDLKKYFEKQNEQILQEIKQLKRHPAWGFSKKKSFVALEKKLKKPLLGALEGISNEVNELKMKFDYFDSILKNRRKVESRGQRKGKRGGRARDNQGAGIDFGQMSLF